MILLQQDSALSKDDKNMAVLVPLITQPHLSGTIIILVLQMKKQTQGS